MIDISRISYYWEMLHFNWNDLMISAQLVNMKIVVTALPNNITNVSTDSSEIQRIQKGFEGEITQSLLQIYVPEDRKQLKGIKPFYDYMCKCFQELALKDRSQIENDKIKVFRQWSVDEATNSKKQRLIIKMKIQGPSDVQVNHEKEPCEFVVKLKQVYLSLNSLLLKTNTIILAQMDYYKDVEKRYQDSILLISKCLQEKMTQQLSAMKKQMQSFIENAMNRSTDSDTEATAREKRHKRMSKHRKEKDVKQEYASQFTVSKKLRSSKDTSKQVQQIKIEQTNGKVEDDQQSKRLRKLQEQEPKQRIIPMTIQYDQQNPAYHFFSYSKRSVTKIGGFDYPTIMLKDIISPEGTHGIIVKYVIKKKAIRCCCIQVGIIDEKVKDLLYSSVCDNYIKFKMNVSTVFTKVRGKQTKKKHRKMRVLKPGQTIEMRVNLGLGMISWTASYGQVVRAEIPKQLLKMNLQAFVGIYTTGDTIQFQEYPHV